MYEVISNGWHWSYGWLRRDDLDDHRGFCYEKPNGEMVFSLRRDHRLLCRLECRIDRTTGKTDIQMSKGATKAYIELYGRKSFSVRRKAM